LTRRRVAARYGRCSKDWKEKFQIKTLKCQSISALLVANSKGTIEREQTNSVKKELKKTLVNSTPYPSFDTRFSAVDLSTAIGDIKKGKAPGRDGVHPEFLHNLGPKALGWLLTVTMRYYITC